MAQLTTRWSLQQNDPQYVFHLRLEVGPESTMFHFFTTFVNEAAMCDIFQDGGGGQQRAAK